MNPIQKISYQPIKVIKAVVKKNSNELLQKWHNEISIKKLMRDIESEKVEDE